MCPTETSPWLQQVQEFCFHVFYDASKLLHPTVSFIDNLKPQTTYSIIHKKLNGKQEIN